MANVQRVRPAEGQVAAENDYEEHQRNYRRFVRGVQLAVAGMATVLLLLASFLLTTLRGAWSKSGPLNAGSIVGIISAAARFFLSARWT